MTEKTYTFEASDPETGITYTWHGVPEYLFVQLMEQYPFPVYHLLNLLGIPENVSISKESS